jgi:hypothetical protein
MQSPAAPMFSFSPFPLSPLQPDRLEALSYFGCGSTAPRSFAVELNT